jgi:hypothetical protein
MNKNKKTQFLTRKILVLVKLEHARVQRVWGVGLINARRKFSPRAMQRIVDVAQDFSQPHPLRRGSDGSDGWRRCGPDGSD